MSDQIVGGLQLAGRHAELSQNPEYTLDGQRAVA
jgi:hypothetical protein